MDIYFYLYFVFVCVLIALSYSKFIKARVFVKVLCSLLFVIIGLKFLDYDYSKYSQFIFFGLVASLFGDLSLGLVKLYPNKSSLFQKIGILLFSLTHIFYSLSFLTTVTVDGVMIIAPIVSVLVIYLITKDKRFNTNSNGGFIMFYSGLITFMMICGIKYMIGYFFDAHSICVAMGVLSFALSDFILLFKYFYKKEIKILTLFNLVLYYGAQLLVVYSIFLRGLL